MARQNFHNRTLWTGDNLDGDGGLNSETISLVYLAPPFNLSRNYSMCTYADASG